MKEKFEFESLLGNPIGRRRPSLLLLFLLFIPNILSTFVFVRDLSTA